MLTLSHADRMALMQLDARTTLPAMAVVAVRMAYLVTLWSCRSRTRKALPALPYGLLDDIGLTPRDAAREARKWFWMS